MDITAEAYKRSKMITFLKISKSIENEILASRFKYRVFYMLHPSIVKKSIERCMSKVRKIGAIPQEAFTNEDLTSEAFIVFDTCFKKIDPNRLEKFMFFYNVALARHYQKMLEDAIKSYNAVVVNGSDPNLTPNAKIGVFNGFVTPQDVDYILNMVDSIQAFSDLEKDVIRSKLYRESMKDFLQKHQVPQKQYQEAMAKIKMVFEKIL